MVGETLQTVRGIRAVSYLSTDGSLGKLSVSCLSSDEEFGETLQIVRGIMSN